MIFRVRYDLDRPTTEDYPRRQQAIERANTLLRTPGIKSLSCALVTVEGGKQVETPIEWIHGV